MSVCPPRVYKTRLVPTAPCSACSGVTPFVCVECRHPHCASCTNHYTGMCAPCVALTSGRIDQTTLQGRHNAYMWAFWDEFMVKESDHLVA